MDLSTTYLGLKLKNPLVVSASPLSYSIDNFKRLEDAGVSAIVNHSLFEEQITHEYLEMNHYLNLGAESSAESLSYVPTYFSFNLDSEEHLSHLYKAKKAVSIPIIGSLNATSDGGWVTYAKQMQQTGIDALELNVYYLAADAAIDGRNVEQMYLDILEGIKANVSIPVAVKLSPYFSALANMAKRLEESGANGLVLFNRFYQPDIDLENLNVVPNVLLSTPQDMRLPLRWIAMLYGKVNTSLAASDGIHTAEDVIKMVMAGADITMLCSVLLKNGTKQVGTILTGIEEWMNSHEYESIVQMRGSMSQKSCANPQAFERANYMKVLQSFSSRHI